MCTPAIQRVQNDPDPPSAESLATVRRMRQHGAMSEPLVSPSQPARTQRSAERVPTDHRYGGFAEFESEDGNDGCAPSPTTKANGSGAKCIPGLINVFVQMREEFLQRDKCVLRYMLDAKDHDWFWRRAADVFNRSQDASLNFNLLHEESYPEEVRALLSRRICQLNRN